MPVADTRYFQREHIDQYRFDAPATLAEQAVHGLELVAELVETGLTFQFKGGNSLLLILPRPQRFSIDIDIAADETRERIEQVLDSIVTQFGVFTSWKPRQHRTKPWLPLASYYLYYNSQFPSTEPPYIMLDVQLKCSPYITEKKRIQCGNLFVCGTEVVLPIPSSIIGDKLLTIGPDTLGIPVGKGKQAQRLKHVFDISMLLRTAASLSAIRNTFEACMEQENSMQNTNYNVQEVMYDTLRFCFATIKYSHQPEQLSDPRESEILEGLSSFVTHLFSRRYNWYRLQYDMARASVCIAALGLKHPTDNEFKQAIALQSTGNEDDRWYIENARKCWDYVATWVNDPVFSGKKVS
jgi:hypothetical protein